MNHYETLSVSTDATHDEIKAAYKRSAQQYHPDKRPDGDPERYQQIQDAYAVLSDPNTRAE